MYVGKDGYIQRGGRLGPCPQGAPSFSYRQLTGHGLMPIERVSGQKCPRTGQEADMADAGPQDVLLAECKWSLVCKGERRAGQTGDTAGLS